MSEEINCVYSADTIQKTLQTLSQELYGLSVDYEITKKHNQEMREELNNQCTVCDCENITPIQHINLVLSQMRQVIGSLDSIKKSVEADEKSYQAYIESTEQANTVYKSSINELKTRCADANERLVRLANENTSIRAQLSSAEDDRKELQTLSEKVNTLDKELKRVRGDISTLKIGGWKDEEVNRLVKHHSYSNLYQKLKLYFATGKVDIIEYERVKRERDELLSEIVSVKQTNHSLVISQSNMEKELAEIDKILEELSSNKVKIIEQNQCLKSELILLRAQPSYLNLLYTTVNSVLFEHRRFWNERTIQSIREDVEYEYERLKEMEVSATTPRNSESAV